MRLAVFACASLLAAGAAASEAEWLSKAERIVAAHHLLSRAELRCSTFVYDAESTSRVASVSVFEKHGGGCPGDPDTGPRRFTLAIDVKSGRVTWDRDDPGTMGPLPR